MQSLLQWGSANCTGWQPGKPATADEAQTIWHILIAEDQLATFLQAAFRLCQHESISFILRQRLAFGCEIELLGDAAGPCLLRLYLQPAWTQGRGNIRRFLGRICKWPTPGTAAVVGPDGSGKTALLDASASLGAGGRLQVKNFKRFFRRPLPYLIRGESRNDRDEKLLGLILPIAWVYFLVSRWLTGWYKPLVLDRYFYDYFVRDVRNMDQPLRRIGAYDLCSALVPCPERLVVATCPTSLIHQRKTEMSAQSIENLYLVYLDQVVRSAVPQTLFCHTGLDLHVSQRQTGRFLQKPGSKQQE